MANPRHAQTNGANKPNNQRSVSSANRGANQSANPRAKKVVDGNNARQSAKGHARNSRQQQRVQSQSSASAQRARTSSSEAANQGTRRPANPRSESASKASASANQNHASAHNPRNNSRKATSSAKVRQQQANSRRTVPAQQNQSNGHSQARSDAQRRSNAQTSSKAQTISQTPKQQRATSKASGAKPLNSKIPSVTTAQKAVQTGSHGKKLNVASGAYQQKTPVTPAYSVPNAWGQPEQVVQKNHRVRNIILIVLAVFVVVTAIMGVLAYMQVGTLKTEASNITKNLKTVTNSMKKGEFDQGASAMRSVSSSVDSVKSSLDSPGIVYFSFFPVIGGDINNAKTIVSNAQTILSTCAVPACEGLESAGSGGFITKDKTINYSAINAVLDPIRTNSATVSQAVENIQQACSFNIPQIANRLGDIDDKLEDVQTVVNVVGQYSDQIMSMIGANGNRKYLLVAQNTDEMRSTGGFPGSVGLVSFENGKIVMGEFASGKQYIEGDRPESCPPTELDQAIYPLGIEYTMDTGYDAHFPNSGKIWLDTYANKYGETLNGVISVSPSMVQDVLKVVGEVKMDDGTVLNGDNATKVLQHDLYWKYLSGKTSSTDNDLADAAFANAAEKSFEKLFSGLNSSTMIKLLKTLPESVEKREFMLYMGDSNEQATVDKLGCSASLSSESSQKKLGFFCGVRSACKLGWWLDESFDVKKSGTNTFHVTATMTSTLTQEELDAGGNYIMGYPFHGTVGDLLPGVYVFAPKDSKISNLTVNNEGTGTEYTQENRQLIYLGQVSLMPQVSATITFDVEVPSGFGDTLEVETNPMLTDYR